MTTQIAASLISVGVSLAVGWLLPAWAISRLLPVLEGSGHLVSNYRGRRIPTGLGLVWLVWAACSWFAVEAWQAVAHVTLNAEPLTASGLPGPTTTFWLAAGNPLEYVPVALVIGAAIFGLVDDVFGDASAKGFRGHVKALARGRLTTGGLKLLGIGILSLAASSTLGLQSSGIPTQSGTIADLALGVATWVLRAVAIALAANLVNLLDLRPGRALKGYGLLVVLGIAIIVSDAFFGSGFGNPVAVHAFGSLEVPLVAAVGLKLSLLALVLGPVAAVWKFDLGERAMLGDAGANAMGALAGWLLVVRSPLWLTAAIVAVLLALNLASEKVSFSKVIEKVAFLRWLDGLGRTAADPALAAVYEGDDGVRAGGPGADGEDA